MVSLTVSNHKIKKEGISHRSKHYRLKKNMRVSLAPILAFAAVCGLTVVQAADSTNTCPEDFEHKCGTKASCILADDGDESSTNYFCVCKDGYRDDPSTPQLNCLDINECLSEGLSNCHANAACVDHSPGYSCVCQQGFTGDGINLCDDINECADGTDTLCQKESDLTCRNTVGSYVCEGCPGGADWTIHGGCGDVPEALNTGVDEPVNSNPCVYNGVMEFQVLEILSKLQAIYCHFTGKYSRRLDIVRCTTYTCHNICCSNTCRYVVNIIC